MDSFFFKTIFAMPVDHYENFPVASVLLPRRLRRAVIDIYRFARKADDIADEGHAAPAQRIEQLQSYRSALHALGAQHPTPAQGSSAPTEIFGPLGLTITRHQLPLTPFLELLSAFEQDVTVHRYADFAALSDYCRRSANPIGRLMLHLYETVDEQSREQSDAICTGLQLVNVLQDVGIDWKIGRVYLPQNELARFGVSESAIAAGRTDDAWRQLMKFQVDRCRTLLNSGSPLGKRLPGRIGLELRLIIEGGRCVLAQIEQVQYDVFRHRPTLRSADWIGMAWRALMA